MPSYDYLCNDCGPFNAIRSMALSAEPCDCPACGANAPRAIFSVPFVAGMDAGRRNAIATNERSSHEPKRASQSGHGPGCGCCGGGRKNRKTLQRPDGSKSFPTARPWQISH